MKEQWQRSFIQTNEKLLFLSFIKIFGFLVWHLCWYHFFCHHTLLSTVYYTDTFLVFKDFVFFSEIKENKTLIKQNQTVIINMTLFLFLKVFPPPSCRFIVKMCSNLQEKHLFSRNQCYVCLIQSLIFHSWQFWHSVNNDLPVVKGLTGLHETDPRKARVNNWLMSKWVFNCPVFIYLFSPPWSCPVLGWAC